MVAILRTISTSDSDQGDFAKTGDFEFAKAKFDDSKWRSLNLPHDWAVELPFVHDDAADIARVQAAWASLSGDQRGLVPARVRDSERGRRQAHLRLSSTERFAMFWCL